MNDDDRLKRAFDDLRAEDARRAPSFDAVRKKKRAKVHVLAIALPVVTLAAALLLLLRSRNDASRSPLAGLSAASSAAPSALAAVAADAPASPVAHAERAPLDFLLDVPLLRGAPDFDTSILEGSVR